MRTSSGNVASRPRHRARIIQTSVAGVLLLGLAGCSGPAATAAGHPPRPSRTADSTSAAPSEDPVAAGVHDSARSTSLASPAAAVARARAAMVAFCRPALDGTAWTTGLDPFLTLAAAQAYATVDPKRVACTHVLALALARLGEGDAFTQLVTVPTDAGPDRVTLARGSSSERWLVFAITPTATR